MSKFRLFNIIASFLLIATAVAAVVYRQDVIDWWRIQQYEPSQRILEITDSTTMVGRGRDLFFASQPVIEGAEAFNIDCSNSTEETLVLGCYHYQQIFIFDVTDERLAGVEEVTAAHEMLHAVYERLSDQDKEKIHSMLDEQIKTVTDQRILDLIETYRKKDETQLYNEMHSILGTEYANLNQDLEEYYKKYFANRQAVVSMSEGYESIFQESRNRIIQMDAALDQLREQINQNNAQLESWQKELNIMSNNLARLRNNNQIEEHNAAVPAYNSKVYSFNALVSENEQLVSRHNQLVQERNSEAAAQNDLYNSLDSRDYQEIPQN